MKLITLFLCIIGLQCYSQEKFTGIGIFKIGTDTTVIHKYAKENDIKISVINSKSDLNYIDVENNKYAKYLKKTKDLGKEIIGRIAKNDENYYLLNAELCADVTQYALTSYKVSDIKLTNVKLTYFKNSLVKFECKYTAELIDALNEKYGKADLIIKNDTTSCVYNLTGITRTLISKTYYQNRIYDNIKVNAFVGSYYNDQCKEVFWSGFSYSIENNDFLKCSSEAIKNRLTPLKAKKDLKDF